MSYIISFDYVIKYLFKDKGNYEIFEGFISAILKDAGYGAVKIKSLLESDKEDSIIKSNLAEILVEDEVGHKYIIEIDKTYTSLFLDKDYSNIKNIFHITLLFAALNNVKLPFYQDKTILKKIDKEPPVNLYMSDMGGRIFDVHNVVVEHFIISVPNFNYIIKDELDEWLYAVKHSEVKEDFKSYHINKLVDRPRFCGHF
ncbi:MAG TPA: hypothetical protein LFW21_00495 [Rickettsia endosymbiont of Pyrocoelia pectoralis]|nr:hypothetical protein [Rickettsia endosymbiont of Pyrocoelia pectoralis]